MAAGEPLREIALSDAVDSLDDLAEIDLDQSGYAGGRLKEYRKATS